MKKEEERSKKGRQAGRKIMLMSAIERLGNFFERERGKTQKTLTCFLLIIV